MHNFTNTVAVLLSDLSVLRLSNESSRDVQSVALQLLDIADQIAVAVLTLAALPQAHFVGRFDPDKHLTAA